MYFQQIHLSTCLISEHRKRRFSKLLQVAGRSGRAEEKGEVIIQTFNPDNPVIHDASQQDFESFFKRTIKEREELYYPPFFPYCQFYPIIGKKNQRLKKKL